MSNIPNSAIPHAVGEHNQDEIDRLEGAAATAAKDLGDRARDVADRAKGIAKDVGERIHAKDVADRAKGIAKDVGERIRATPNKVAIAAGAAAVVGGVVAAVVASRKAEAKPVRKRTPVKAKPKTGASS